MDATFQIVYPILKWIAEVTGLTYNEVNTITYYILLPFVYAVLADRILKKHILKTLYIGVIAASLILIKDFTEFSDWMFQKSVDFLLSFQFLGWNYIVSSVMICVVFPAIIFVVMFHFAFPRFFRTVMRSVSISRDSPQDQSN